MVQGDGVIGSADGNKDGHWLFVQCASLRRGPMMDGLLWGPPDHCDLWDYDCVIPLDLPTELSSSRLIRIDIFVNSSL